MIRLLRGTIEGKEERAIILFVNGVGYHVLVPGEIINLEEKEITLYIHTHVREDAINLYGFRTKNELGFFELLLTINGIGPKMAMEILNQPIGGIKTAIFRGDIPALTSIPGVGRKIAERLILELKTKVEPTDENDRKQQTLTASSINPDVLAALEGLGYKKHQIEKVLHAMEEDLSNPEEIIRYFLQKV